MLLCRRHHLDTHVRMLRPYGTMDPSEAMDIKAAMSIKANLIRVNGWAVRGDSLRRHWPGMDLKLASLTVITGTAGSLVLPSSASYDREYRNSTG